MTTVDQTVPVTAEHTSSAVAGEPGSRRSVWRVVGSVLVTTLLAGLVALAGASVVVPRLIGAVPLTVVSGSMEPSISPGDLVVVRPVDAAQIAMGDVITFQPESDNPALVTHRVIGVTLGAEGVSGFVTQGDANNAADTPIVADQVKGRVAYTVPLVGWVTNLSWGPQVVGVGAVGLLVYGLVTLVLPERSDRKTDRTNREEAHDA
jgi:signal peptidase